MPIFEIMGRHAWRNQQTASKYQHYQDAQDEASAAAAVANLDLGLVADASVVRLDERRRKRKSS